MLTWGQESLGKDLRVHVDEALSYSYRSEENRVKSEIVVQLLWMGGAAGSVRIGNGRSTVESRFRPRAAAGVQLLPPSLQNSLASESSSTTHAWPVHEAIPESQEVSSSVTRGISECILLTINMLIIMKQAIGTIHRPSRTTQAPFQAMPNQQYYPLQYFRFPQELPVLRSQQI